VTIENSPQFQLRDKIEKRQSLEEAAEIIKAFFSRPCGTAEKLISAILEKFHD
jgi:hypothetical protein